jgi:hypothetical protein
MESTPLSVTEALQNFEELAMEFNAQISDPAVNAGTGELPSVSDLKHLMSNTSYVEAPGTLAGGKKMKYGGSKKKKSSRSRRADLRERYKLSPRKRGKTKNKKSKKVKRL